MAGAGLDRGEVILRRFARSCAAAILFVAATAALHAHPATGIVIARDGSVYYSDLERVWRVDGATGRRTVAVEGVHTHELYIDDAGSVFGEDNEWLGGDRYRHRIWRRAPDGRVTDVVSWQNTFWRRYGLTRDAAGTMYWVSCTPARVCSVSARDRRGTEFVAAPAGSFRSPINWIAATPEGEVLIVEGRDLRVARSGRVTTRARVTNSTDPALMGIAVDRAGNAYVASFRDRAIVRVTPAGAVKIVARSSPPWAPSGVAVTSAGELWLLEWDGSQVQARKIQPR